MKNIIAFSKRNIIGIAVTFLLIVGLIIGVYLVQQQQQLKSKASGGNFINAFEIKDANDKILDCTANADGTATCNTDTLDIKVRVKDANALIPQ